MFRNESEFVAFCTGQLRETFGKCQYINRTTETSTRQSDDQTSKAASSVDTSVLKRSIIRVASRLRRKDT